ncbi:MAG: hypothetical protein ACPLKQ_01440 [Candidatus Bathyarchaeales archaeon]
METSRGKLVVYASRTASQKKRLKSVSVAVEKTAKKLNLDIEIIALKNRAAPIYVYYENGDGEELVPLYCDKNQKSTIEHVCNALRSMMFVLSFHPKYSALKKIRKEIIRFS